MSDDVQAEKVDKAALLQDRDAVTAEVEIAGFGVIKVRALTRAEVLQAGDITESKGLTMGEAHLIATAAIEPTFTIEEVKRWQKISPAAEIEPLTEAINHLSGMTDTAADHKADTLRFP